MNLNDVGTIVQILTLPVLVATVWATWKGVKSAQQAAQIAFRQFEIAREQLHSSFRPALDVQGDYGPNCAQFTIRNIGLGPAFNVTARYRCGSTDSLGNLKPDARTEFCFDYNRNALQKIVGMGNRPGTMLPPVQDVPLRLEYESVTGARCWTNVEFKLGADITGPVGAETKQGITTTAI